MIFVTVGTHEQPFDRLIKGIDRLKAENRIDHEVFIQAGYTSYKPQSCLYSDFVRFDEIIKRMTEADIIITHGGTASIMLALYRKKIPIVFPRQAKHGEHIDDHQVRFTKTMEAKGKILAAYEVEDLEQTIKNYSQAVRRFNAENPGKETGDSRQLEEKAAIFAEKMHQICLGLVKTGG